MESQHGRAKVHSLNLGQLEWGKPTLFPFGPEAYASARPGSTSAAGALRGRCLADPSQVKAVETALRVVMGRSCQTAVDHGRHAINRQRGFGDVGREDNLPPRAGPQGHVL